MRSGPALELVDAVRALGPAIAGAGRRPDRRGGGHDRRHGQGMVAGDMVNTASRLQSVAPPGPVLVGEATQRAAAERHRLRGGRRAGAQGQGRARAAWRAAARRRGARRRGRSDALEAPFVGRDEELRLLKDCSTRRPRAAGAPRVASSGRRASARRRLAWEFLKYIDGLVETVWWHDGRSPAYGEGITFWALGEMVRGRCRPAERDDEADDPSRDRRDVREHVPDETSGLDRTGAARPCSGIGPGVGSDQLFGAWRTFFERLAERARRHGLRGPPHADTGLLDSSIT